MKTPSPPMSRGRLPRVTTPAVDVQTPEVETSGDAELLRAREHADGSTADSQVRDLPVRAIVERNHLTRSRPPHDVGLRALPVTANCVRAAGKAGTRQVKWPLIFPAFAQTTIAGPRADLTERACLRLSLTCERRSRASSLQQSSRRSAPEVPPPPQAVAPHWHPAIIPHGRKDSHHMCAGRARTTRIRRAGNRRCVPNPTLCAAQPAQPGGLP